VVDEQRKHAYRYLLYWATLEIRPLAWLGQGGFRSWNPFFWRREGRRVQFAGALANWLHNLAQYSSVDFARFNEDWFWKDFEHLRSRYPEFGLERYHNLFEERASASLENEGNPQNSMARGVFLSLDGLDGTGKSTQWALLADWLRARGHVVTQCADPGGTPVGDIVRKLLLEHRGEMSLPCEAFLFMASRAQLTAEVIRPALKAGQIVVSDRFLLANVVYQGHAGGLDPERLWQIGRLSSGGLEPDLTVVLDLSPEEARQRRGRPADRVESRAADYQQRVRDGFLSEARRRPERIVVVDAARPIEEVHAQICQEVARVMAAGPRT
jgi:dTMP kinase